ERVGYLSIHPDGYGYLRVPVGEAQIDSLYLTQRRINWWKLQQGDYLRVQAEPVAGAHPSVHAILERNGHPFDEAELYHRPKQGVVTLVLLFFYTLLSFLIIMLLTVGGERKGYSLPFYLKRMVACLVVAVLLYMVAPVQRWRTGELLLNFASGQMLDYMLLLRVIFAVIVSMLYGYIYGPIAKSQQIALENENLKNENLTSRYNMLVSQVNPHFFFNSLNSLSMLVREGQTERALTYIDHLSYTFRYILQNRQATLVTLEDELRFAEAYGYLFKTRYADKLFFDIEVEERMRPYLLPALTLQPLLGNAVKHNTITRQQPLHVSIRTEGEVLIIENPLRPKLDPEPGMGIGLENLRNRWDLILGQNIEVRATQERFEVRLPLQKPLKR
ncbi:MAG: histidine kinase, partial [Alistipes sp.]|nr:histidine kinase [Alistipes sp.]